MFEQRSKQTERLSSPWSVVGCQWSVVSGELTTDYGLLTTDTVELCAFIHYLDGLSLASRKRSLYALRIFRQSQRASEATPRLYGRIYLPKRKALPSAN